MRSLLGQDESKAVKSYAETERRALPCYCGCGRIWSLTQGLVTVGGTAASFFVLPTRHGEERVAWIAIGDGAEPSAWVWIRTSVTGPDLTASIVPASRLPYRSFVAPVLEREQVLGSLLHARIFAVHDELAIVHPDLRHLVLPEEGRDFSFQMPDCVFAQPKAERSSRNQKNFAECGERLFVRALLPIPVSDGGELRIGVWVEVPSAQFFHLLRVWDEPSAYMETKLSGRIESSLQLNHNAHGAAVQLAPRSAEHCLFVKSAAPEWMKQLLSEGILVSALPAFLDRLQRCLAANSVATA